MELRKSGIVQSSSGSKYAVEHFSGNGTDNSIILKTSNKRGKETFVLGTAAGSGHTIDGIGQVSGWGLYSYYYYSKDNLRIISESNYGTNTSTETVKNYYTIEEDKVTLSISIPGNDGRGSSWNVYVIDEL